MLNLWNDEDAREFARDPVLGLRVYSSQLLGRDADLVLHGGGNTSVKGVMRNVFGDLEDVLFVKGSGWDLQSIQAGGFAPVRLAHLRALASLPALSDTDMMRELRLALCNPSAPTPSVEAILHALIPSRYVDHTHADAVVALSNTPHGEALLREVYGEDVLILPYVMPGFVLAQQVHEATQGVEWTSLKGIILMHHGIITFDEDCQASYSRMISLVSRAEEALRARGAWSACASAPCRPSEDDYHHLARLRREAGSLLGAPVLARWDQRAEAVGFASLPEAGTWVERGPLTPDHSLHTKPFSAVLDADPLPGLHRFKAEYDAYFTHHAQPHHTCLDPVARVGLWRDRGMLSVATDPKRLQIVSDIMAHTVRAIQWGEALGGWTALPRADQFALEYWELEQAKLKRTQARAEGEGRVVVVTGAASGIGRACVDAFVAEGAAVVALDISPAVTQIGDPRQVLGIVCDITDETAVTQALHRAVAHFGGIDVLVSNAGIFPPSAALDAMDVAHWDHSLNLNLSAPMRLLSRCIPFLALGFSPAVVFVGSKNVPAPGPGAGAYSVAKAGLAQLARVAALELGDRGIRVNTVHPNAVFDTGLWTDEVLAQRAAHYGMSVEAYKSNNVLRREITSRDVAAMVVAMAGSRFACTTGAQVPVDGGNERII